MPTYDYIVKEGRGCAHCRKGFEEVQRLSDPPLAACPKCGAPVRRQITGCQVNTLPSDKAKMSDKNLKRLGFSKLVNEGGGKFRKV